MGGVNPIVPAPSPFAGLSVAIVHYWLVTWRGGENVIRSMLRLFPDADIYTLFHDPELCEAHLPGRRVYGSCLDVGPLRRRHRAVFPLYPSGIRSLRLRRPYDLVISSESGPAKGIRVPEGTPHLCYVHTPMRYCWGFTDDYLKAIPGWARPVAARAFERLRRWDLTTVDNVDRYVANCQNVAERVARHYGREAGVCHPPIDLSLFDPAYPESRVRGSGGGHYLSFGALTPYKKVELLIDTFRSLPDRTLRIVGDGSERSRLEALAGPNVEFLGELPWSDIHEHILGARALLFPGEEDFGMVPLEVMAHGTPVIAYGKGGALETVIDAAADPGRGTGLFFEEPTVECLLASIRHFESMEGRFDPHVIAAHARSFGEDHFLATFDQEVRALLAGENR